MAGSILICLNSPSLPFQIGCEVFPAKPPWFSAKIYPLLSFELPLEFDPRSAIPISTSNVHLACSLENPLAGFSPFRHFDTWGLPWIGFCIAYQEHLQGLVTLLMFVIL